VREWIAVCKFGKDDDGSLKKRQRRGTTRKGRKSRAESEEKCKGMYKKLKKPKKKLAAESREV